MESFAYKIELRIQTDNEDFMHDTNQYEFKMDGERRVSRGYASDGLGGSKETDTGQRLEILESWRALC